MIDRISKKVLILTSLLLISQAALAYMSFKTDNDLFVRGNVPGVQVLKPTHLNLSVRYGIYKAEWDKSKGESQEHVADWRNITDFNSTEYVNLVIDKRGAYFVLDYKTTNTDKRMRKRYNLFIEPNKAYRIIFDDNYNIRSEEVGIDKSLLLDGGLDIDESLFTND